MVDKVLVDKLWKSKEAPSLTNKAAAHIEKLEVLLQKAVNERNQAWFELEELREKEAYAE
jgi:hypothetical protein